MTGWRRAGRIAAVVSWGLWMASVLTVRERFGARTDLGALRLRSMQRFMAALSSALGLEIRVAGAIPREPMLWLSNHVSWLDIPVMGQLTPIAFLSKDNVRQWPIAGWLAHHAGTLFVRRGASEHGGVREQMASHLRAGRALLMFPEGTTTEGQDVATFHGRLLACAVETRTRIQPVAIRYLRDGVLDPIAPFLGEDNLLSHLKRFLRHGPGIIEVRLLAPLASGGQSRNALARASQSAIRQALLAAPLPVNATASGEPERSSAELDRTPGSLQ